MSERGEAKAVCWVVTDGRAGIEAQAMGLAEAVAEIAPIAIVRKRIDIRSPWRFLPWSLWGGGLSRLSATSDPLSAPFPDIWIGCGRLSTPLTIAVKKRSPKTFTVQLQDPRAPTSLFDLVIPPAHDRLVGDNVFSIIGSPGRLGAGIKETASSAGGEIKSLAVLVGGPNRAFRMTEDVVIELADTLAGLAASGVRLRVTTSRRTPAEAAKILMSSLPDAAAFYSVGLDAPENNPYPAMLKECDAIVVTEDSVNMATEAAATGKPVFVAKLKRRPFASSTKFDAFHMSLREYGAARPFAGKLESWTYTPLDETRRAAREVVRRWREHASRPRVR